MTYRDGYDSFMLEYGTECMNAGKPALVFNKQKVMSLMSKAYVYLGNTYELVEANPVTVRLVAGQWEYTTGAGNTNIPANVLRIHTVKLQDAAETQLDKVGLLNMPRGERASGLPGKWTVQGTNSARKLIINTSPDKSYAADDTYALSVYYKEKLFRFTGAAAGSFADLDYNAADWGGDFLLPTEWDDMIISGAVAFALSAPGKINDWYAMAKEMGKSKKSDSYQGRKPKYFLGV